MHKGRISASSAGPGQGASFFVTFPLYPRATKKALEADSPTRALQLEGLRVLVIEDAADTRDLLGIILQSYGCQVDLAESVPVAWKKVLEHKPDVIVSDIGLPDADGYEFARQLRGTHGYEQIPMIALTGYAMDADRQKAYDSGFNYHLPKPIDPDLLLRTIDEVHRGRDAAVVAPSRVAPSVPTS
jgi:CheY-like chemotaxis protein